MAAPLASGPGSRGASLGQMPDAGSGLDEEAAKADALYYRQLTLQRRLEILLELIEQADPDLHAPGQGLQRVYRVVKLESL